MDYSETIQKRLLCESNLTLERAIEISVSMEMAAKEAQELSVSSQVHKVWGKKMGWQESMLPLWKEWSSGTGMLVQRQRLQKLWKKRAH